MYNCAITTLVMWFLLVVDYSISTNGYCVILPRNRVSYIVFYTLLLGYLVYGR